MTTMTNAHRLPSLGVCSVASVIGEGLDFRDALQPNPEFVPREVIGFDRIQRLGRKGTSTFDRVTSLALAACGEALTAASLPETEQSTDRFGVVAATTNASLKSVTDFSRATFEEERPYLVNPMLFPNTVMNCAAGQAAIRFQLRGPNATIAGADLAGIQMLRYALGLARHGYLDQALVFGVEELTPEYRALHAHSRVSDVPLSEGAASAVLTNDVAAADAQLSASAVVTRMTSRGESIATATRRCLRRVNVTADSGADVVLAVTPLEEDVVHVAKSLGNGFIGLVDWSGFLRSAQAIVGVGVAVEAIAAAPSVSRVVLLGQGNEDQIGVAVIERVEG